MDSVRIKVPRAKYTKVGETLRHVIPSQLQCSVGCGGRACKYENPSRWSEDQQAIKGIYSSWITEKILAMARPSTQTIEKFNIIDQFQRCGLRTVINLQSPGEHASCGNPLEPESGFTYRPEAFMEMGIYFYNFGWKDYGVASLTTILDMVKVMSFALQEGKIAVHCHAGLGRTGVLLACYLVFAERMSADQAILFVRAKRPNSIQTRGQLLCVQEFAHFLVPLRSVFSCAESKASAVTLSQFLIHQQHLLHGYEARRFKNIPKLVKLICRLLLEIADSRQVDKKEVLEIPDVEALVKKTSKEIIIQHLSTGIIGKGAPHLPSPQATHKRTSEFYIRSCLSYSDSDLCRLKPELKHLDSHLSGQANTFHNNSYNSMDEAQLLPPFMDRQNFYSSSRSVGEQPTFHSRHFLKDTQLSKSLGMPSKGENITNATIISALMQHSKRICSEHNISEHEKKILAVPCIPVQMELMLHNRHFLVAQALSVDLEEECGEYSKDIANWQKKLNSEEEAWERLCVERDPFILSGLMWSWLEQLKEPIISKDEVQTMEKNNQNPSNVLDSLAKGPKQTLACILDCFAHLVTIQDNVQYTFLNRTIKAFTKIKKDSYDGKTVYSSMRRILTLVLQGMRMKAMDSSDSPGYTQQLT